MGEKSLNMFLETAEASVFVRTNKLVMRSLRLSDRQTTVRLEPQVWKILQDVAEEHDSNVNDLCDLIDKRKGAASTLSSAIRVFLISYLHIQTKKGG